MPDLPPKSVRLIAYVIVLLSLGMCWARSRDDITDNPAYDALAKAHTRKLAGNAVALHAADSSLAVAQQRTSSSVARYIKVRDSLVITDTVQVKVFVQRADSVVRACSELAESCDRFRVRAESSLAGLTLDRDRWKLAAESQKPSKWRAALPYVAFVGGVWIGSRVTR